jgi:hypothetical protein
MAIVRNDAGQLVGELRDTYQDYGARDDSEPTCNAMYLYYGCTLPKHCAEYPHLAGTGQEIVAIWWEGEYEDVIHGNGQW